MDLTLGSACVRSESSSSGAHFFPKISNSLNYDHIGALHMQKRRGGRVVKRWTANPLGSARDIIGSSQLLNVSQPRDERPTEKEQVIHYYSAHGSELPSSSDTHFFQVKISIFVKLRSIQEAPASARSDEALEWLRRWTVNPLAPACV
ncbi:hypothetical protein AVEN_264638-1 [Araneus ventricosus]|uniref:Uncharacterized protein n=1 Tax=Araneus ventricosus TaxID=182803 RepID=A0A4Y2T3P1_ARAVE|nr:hypothetical protein AVEN_264638-1 [Araneus ventricosus]